jgi:hypothetical protein
MKIRLIALALLPAANGQTSSKCAALTQFKIPGVAIAITKAELIPAAASGKASFPAYCQVDGMIDQRTGAGGESYGIGFAVALPDTWNKSFLFQGGGGFNGVVRPPLGAAAAGDISALARGFAIGLFSRINKPVSILRTSRSEEWRCWPNRWWPLIMDSQQRILTSWVARPGDARP